jgi:hypothetical protein
MSKELNNIFTKCDGNIMKLIYTRNIDIRYENEIQHNKTTNEVSQEKDLLKHYTNLYR